MRGGGLLLGAKALGAPTLREFLALSGTVGTVAVSVDGAVAVFGLVGTSALGTASTRTVNYAPVTGVSATGGIGNVVVSGNVDILATGLVAISAVGTVNVWGEVDTNQTPDWQGITNTQSPNWQEIAA